MILLEFLHSWIWNTTGAAANALALQVEHSAMVQALRWSLHACFNNTFLPATSALFKTNYKTIAGPN